MRFSLRAYLDKQKVIRALGSFDCNALLHAAGEGRLECVNILIDAGIDINCQDHQGHTPLHAAVICQQIPIIHRLLSSGSNPNVKDKSGQTPLLHAIGTGDRHVFELLCEYNARLDMKDNLGEDALFKAVKAGDTTLTRKVLVGHVKVNQVNVYGETPLMIAVDHERVGIVKSLLAAGADPNLADKGGETVLDRPIASPRVKRMLHRASLQHRFEDINPSPSPSLDIPFALLADSLLTQFPRTSNLLFNIAGTFITNLNEQVPLDEAQQKGRDVLQQFAAPFGTRSRENGTPKKEEQDLAGSVRKQADLDGALIEVVKAGSDQLVNVLLELGANVNQPDETGKTPLFFALRHQSTTRLLLEYGADPYHRDHAGLRPLDIARQLGKNDLIGMMVAYASTDR